MLKIAVLTGSLRKNGNTEEPDSHREKPRRSEGLNHHR